ncbi:hypothetical protein PMI01_00637 [Caulobacter sp. AP07]|uniref:hypothetical protein n=1 Tax=Caulobacter sp. AP07 TaxID=1144304 RepID=UPI000271ED59|nr:hypothetical protein [Caulobacter sp. AP07]EJL37559.1 hypothetical protein PMI01_00637 [Caulobacter sp. AP07]
MSSIFWSWQSDLDARVTRDVVRDALALAIDALHVQIEERHELTSDTKGVPGSPDIVATILAKIDAAAVFVGDVTPIAVSSTGKALANPNVLIELGYAKKALTLSRIILVWNTAFDGARPEALPFDLRGRRAPIGFHLPTGATKAELAAAREGLKSIFVEALGASLATVTPVPPAPALEWRAATPQTPALWFEPSAELPINEDGVAGRKSFAPGRHFYARILPAAWSPPSDFGIGGHAPLLHWPGGFSWGTTRGGFLTYSGSLRSGAQTPLERMTMQFRATGEVWAVDRLLGDNATEGRFYADDVIATWDGFLTTALAYLREQGARGPFKVKLGATRLEGLVWTSQTGWGGRPQALEDRVEASFSLAGEDEGERLAALEGASGEVAAAFGLPAPDRPTLLKQISGR